MAKKKKKQKRKVAPTFNRILERSAGGELEFVWESEDKSMSAMTFPVFMIGTHALGSGDDVIEGLITLCDMIWHYVSSTDEDLRDKAKDGVLEMEKDPEFPFCLSKVFLELEDLYKDMFPEVNEKTDGKIKRRLSADSRVMSTYIAGTKPEYIPEGLDALANDICEHGL